MTPINGIPAVCNYGTSAVYSDYPSEEQLRAGVVPLDSLPAAWWNKMWCATNGAINEARDMVGQLITEINSVLAQAGICPSSACTDQLYQSINLIRQRLATASVPGAVVSSSAAGAIAVANDGTMSVNCLGNIASLTTATSTIVGAINELKTTYDNCFTSVGGAIDTLNQGKAPVGHASTQATYGVGNASCYGHVKLSDSFTAVLDDCEGVAASQYALATVYSCIQAAASLGNTVACPLGIVASAGCCATAARSDHVHLAALPTVTCYNRDEWLWNLACWLCIGPLCQDQVACSLYTYFRRPFTSPGAGNVTDGSCNGGSRNVTPDTLLRPNGTCTPYGFLTPGASSDITYLCLGQDIRYPGTYVFNSGTGWIGTGCWWTVWNCTCMDLCYCATRNEGYEIRCYTGVISPGCCYSIRNCWGSQAGYTVSISVSPAIPGWIKAINNITQMGGAAHKSFYIPIPGPNY